MPQAYQDSLESYTPQSQRMPTETLAPGIEIDHKDKYDLTKMSHRQYFMP